MGRVIIKSLLADGLVTEAFDNRNEIFDWDWLFDKPIDWVPLIPYQHELYIYVGVLDYVILSLGDLDCYVRVPMYYLYFITFCIAI